MGKEQPELRVRYDEGAPRPVLAVEGDLDIATAPLLRETLLRVLDADCVPDLLVDLSGIRFVDSSGLAVLLMGARRWEAEGRAFVVHEPSRAMSRIIDLTGVRAAFAFA